MIVEYEDVFIGIGKLKGVIVKLYVVFEVFRCYLEIKKSFYIFERDV